MVLLRKVNLASYDWSQTIYLWWNLNKISIFYREYLKVCQIKASSLIFFGLEWNIKPYENELTMREQNLPLECCQPLEMLISMHEVMRGGNFKPRFSRLNSLIYPYVPAPPLGFWIEWCTKLYFVLFWFQFPWFYTKC